MTHLLLATYSFPGALKIISVLTAITSAQSFIEGDSPSEMRYGHGKRLRIFNEKLHTFKERGTVV